jgi:hypothetical protein
MPPTKSPSSSSKKGRPRKPPHEIKGKPLSLKFTGESRRQIDSSANEAGLDPAVWGRSRLQRVALHEASGLALDSAYEFALEWLNKENPTRYAAIVADLAKNKRKLGAPIREK